MKSVSFIAVAVVAGVLVGCPGKKTDSVDGSAPAVAPALPTAAGASSAHAAAAPSANRDRSLEAFSRLLEQADSIHREAWWVLTSDRRPVGKSPFGKVQRALLSSENVKLSNKSLFRCDRYLVKRDILGVSGYPQKAEIFEKCSEKQSAKKIAEMTSSKEGEMELRFFPDGLEEVLGLSASILNKTITCSLRGSSTGSLNSLNCKDWSQERTKEQMIRLDIYDYEKDAQNMIKLRGKVYENLSDIRKIEADIPMAGKIQVTETELYAPTPTPTVTPVKPSPTPKAPVANQAPGGNQGESETGSAPAHASSGVQAQPAGPGPLAAPGEEGKPMDPDLIQQRIQALSPGALPAVDPNNPPAESNNPADQGWPTEDGETVQDNPQPLEPDAEQPHHQQQQQLQSPPAAQPSRPGGGPVGR